MCWLCGVIRPYDGPNELGLFWETGQHRLAYRVGGTVYWCNEEADWEALDEFPNWEDQDAFGIPFFQPSALPT